MCHQPAHRVKELFKAINNKRCAKELNVMIQRKAFKDML